MANIDVNPNGREGTELAFAKNIAPNVMMKVVVHKEPIMIGRNKVFTEVRVYDNHGTALGFTDKSGEKRVSCLYYDSQLTEDQIKEELIPFYTNNIDLIIQNNQGNE